MLDATNKMEYRDMLFSMTAGNQMWFMLFEQTNASAKCNLFLLNVTPEGLARVAKEALVSQCTVGRAQAEDTCPECFLKLYMRQDARH